MLRVSQSAFCRKIQVRLFHLNKPWIEIPAIQNVRAKKSFAFEPNMKIVLKSLRKLLACTESKAFTIYDQFPSIRSIDMMTNVGKNIEILIKNNITTDTIIDNPFLIVMNEDTLVMKLAILRKLESSEIMFNDLVPLLEMKADRLYQVCDLMLHEQSRIPGGNRILYISQKLKLEPKVVSKQCAKNDYLLVTPFENVDRKVQILLDYNIKPMSILKSIYALNRSEHVYVSRLQRLISLNTKDVKMRVFKCADDVFEKYLNRMQHINAKQTDDKIEPQNSKKVRIEAKLNEMLECDSNEAAHIYYNQINRFDQIDCAKQNIEFLRSNGVSLETITYNSAVLAMPFDQLQQNMNILLEMNFKHIDDYLPLICTETMMLNEFKEILDEQQFQEPTLNPIYYFSEKLKVQPSIVSTCFAKNASIFFRSPQILCQKLDTLLEFRVESDSILKSPLTFRINLSILKNRLIELQNSSIEPIYSWMLTRSIPKLKAMKEKRNEQQNILNGCGSAVEYIAKRLNWDQETTERALKSSPAIGKCNIAKAKKLLDYLLNETHFTESDITSFPRVFASSVDTLTTRLEELSTVRFVPKRLYFICLERKRYLEMIETHCQRLNDDNIWQNFRLIEKRIKEK